MKDYLPMSLINLFDVQRRPYSVLLNLDGQVLFSGHPSDITASMIDKYASQVKSRPVKAWADLFTVKSSQPASAVPVQKGAGEVTVKKTSETSKWMYSESGMFYYSGTISDLIKLLSDCSPYQVQLSGMSDYGVTMTCSDVDFISSKTKLLQTVKEKLSLNIHTESKTLSATILNVAVPNKLWSDKHINWGYDATQTYIVGADRIEANNLTINQMANILSDVKGKFYYYKGYDTSLHDWSIHYLYENLMKEDLTSTFGITLTNEKVEVPVFIVSPK